MQAWDKALELVAIVDGDLPARSVRLQQPGDLAASASAIRAGGRAAAQSDQPRLQVRAPYGNLAAVLLALGRWDEAKAVLRMAPRSASSSSALKWLTYGSRSTRLTRDDGPDAGGVDWRRPDQCRSRLAGARRGVFRRGARRHDSSGAAFRWRCKAASMRLPGSSTVEDAEVHALVGQCAEARSEVAGGLLLSRDNFTLERASRTLAWCGAGDQVSALLEELGKRYAEATFTQRLVVPLTRAVLAYEKRDSQGALNLLTPLMAFDRAPRSEFWTEYVRGLSYLQNKDGRAAAAQFQSVIGHRGDYPNSPIYPLSYLGLARASALAGDGQAARQAYLDFLRLWKNADDDLQPLTSARQEYAQLQ